MSELGEIPPIPVLIRHHTDALNINEAIINCHKYIEDIYIYKYNSTQINTVYTSIINILKEWYHIDKNLWNHKTEEFINNYPEYNKHNNKIINLFNKIN